MKGTEITPAVRAAVLERDGREYDGCPCCVYCGKPFQNGGAHLHHVERRSQGGRGEAENLVTLCTICHNRLHNGHSEIQDYCKKYLERIYE